MRTAEGQRRWIPCWLCVSSIPLPLQRSGQPWKDAEGDVGGGFLARAVRGAGDDCVGPGGPIAEGHFIRRSCVAAEVIGAAEKLDGRDGTWISIGGRDFHCEGHPRIERCAVGG